MTDLKVLAVGVDRGFGFTKYFSKENTGKFDSLISKISEDEAKKIIENNKNDENVIVVMYEGEYFLVGKKVSQIRPEDGKRDLRRSRDNQKEMILFLTGLALSTGKDREAEVIVTTGLPTEDYDKYKKDYKKEILNDKKPHEIAIWNKGKGIKKKIKIEVVSIENQPKGSMINLMNENIKKGKTLQEIQDKKIAICDIGYNTTDLSVYSGKDMVSSQSLNFSIRATHSIIKDVQKIVFEKYNANKSDEDILRALETGKIKYRGREIDVSEEVKNAFLKNGEDIVEKISSSWEEKLDDFDEIYLTGGALENNVFALILQELFKEKTGWMVSVVKNPQQANVYGFYLISQSVVISRNYNKQKMRARDTRNEENI
jgi:plasmid segregation protein ParM